jgi:hypothetical protein
MVDIDELWVAKGRPHRLSFNGFSRCSDDSGILDFGGIISEPVALNRICCYIKVKGKASRNEMPPRDLGRESTLMEPRILRTSMAANNVKGVEVHRFYVHRFFALYVTFILPF